MININFQSSKSKVMKKGSSIAGKNMYIPGMDYAGTRLLSSVFKSIGINAIPHVYADAKTLELGSKYTSGEECLPEKVTIGDFMKEVLSPNFDPQQNVFFIPISGGPCRFGQYAPYFKLMLQKLGYNDIQVVSPTCENGYSGLAEDTLTFLRKAWWALLSADILRKMTHKVRPYEKTAGTTDKVFERSIERLEYTIQRQDISASTLFKNINTALRDIKREYMSISADFTRHRPLIGVVGEIFCRLNEFSNNNLIRHVEELGGECWLSDMAEWFWYTNFEEDKNIRYAGKKYSLTNLAAKVKHYMQRRDEHKLYGIFHNEFIGSEEPDNIYIVLNLAAPYLHPDAALGEMTLSVGKSIYLYKKGADGVIDISPFSCMNGIVSEAVYPAVSKDHDEFPIKSLYFDGRTNSSIERDLPIFMEMVRGYMSKKTHQRIYPWYFDVNN